LAATAIQKRRITLTRAILLRLSEFASGEVRLLKEACMDVARFVLATLACCVLSASMASAAHHHGHQARAGIGTSASGAGAADLGDAAAKSATGVEGAGSGDKPASDQSGRHSIGFSGTGASNGPGRNQAVGPVPGGVNVGGVDAPIDTSITVNQGPALRNAKRGKGGEDVGAVITGIRQRLLGKLSSTAVPKTSSLQPLRRDHQPKFSTKAVASVTRNAIGAAVERGSTKGSATTGIQGSAMTGSHEAGLQGPNGVVSTVTGQPEPGGASISNSNLGVQHNGHSDPEGTTVIVPAVHGLGINGTGLIRPGTGFGSLGGPAKVVAGINGSTVRMRSP
jgi:hypothetical protein